MSQAPHQNTPAARDPNEPRALNDDAVMERHEGPVRTPKQLIAAVLASFLIPIGAIALLTNFVWSGKKEAPGSNLNEPKAIAARLAPVAKMDWRDASAVRVLKTGEDVYKAQCIACHAAGAAGAPKFGDAGAWAPRLGQGYEALLISSLKGKGAMAAQGGGDHDDVEIGRAVVYMANAAGGKFAVPQAPAAASAVAADAAPVAVAAVSAGAPNAVQAALAAAAAAPAVVKVNAGEALYKQACVACHAVSVAGSPKFGDKAAWAPRMSLGVAGLTASVIKGKGAMPPRGGTQGSDDDIKLAVEYMVNAAK